MKNKILKAIDKGLMNVLSTDIEDQDIDFGNARINNEYVPPISIEELYDIYWYQDSLLIFQMKYDTKNAVSLILEGGAEISLYEYNNSMKPAFIKISNEQLRDNNAEIYIYLKENHCIEKLKWQNSGKQVQLPQFLVNNSQPYHADNAKFAIKDFSGYTTCQRLMNVKQSKTLPALEHCMSLTRENMQGYLPTAGQLNVFGTYIFMINFILSYIGYKTIDVSERYWSSSEYYASNVWVWSQRCVFSNIKNRECMALPFFTFKK